MQQAAQEIKHVRSGWPEGALEHVDPGTARRPDGGVRWAEEGDGAAAGRGGEVGDAAIVAEVEAGARQAAREGDERSLLQGAAGQLHAAFEFGRSRAPGHGVSPVLKLRRDGAEPVQRPVLPRATAAGMKDHAAG